jgi:CHAD domain-containing protein
MNRSALRSGRRHELHALRIEVKRLRYAVEFFRSLLGPESAAALELLGRVQERLGTISDAVAFTSAYRTLLARLGPDDPRRPGLLARIAAERVQRRQALAELRAGLAAEGEPAYPERLAVAISAALGSLSPKSDS